MPRRSERRYYQQRALHALTRARLAGDRKIASIHLELFRNYLDRIAGVPWRPSEQADA